MDQVSPDLLLPIFKELNSRELVSFMRVERRWLQIIDENRALWRELVLPPKKQGWGLQTLELFDRKSDSTLKRVSLDVAKEVESGPFVEVLQKSKDSLRVLEIKRNYGVKTALEENFWKFQALVECRLMDPSNWDYKLRLRMEERDDDREDNKGSSLRVLWISDSKRLLKSHLYLLDNLVSLVLEKDSYDSLGIRTILERPSRTLKHLRIAFGRGEQPQLPTLSFPNLSFLDITLYLRSALVFPSWMKLPSLSTLIIRNSRTLSSLPACSKLWLVGLDVNKDMLKLAFQCPELVELRIDMAGVVHRDVSAWKKFKTLSSMLSQRKANVEAGMEIGGIKMVNLKTLFIFLIR